MNYELRIMNFYYLCTQNHLKTMDIKKLYELYKQHPCITTHATARKAASSLH